MKNVMCYLLDLIKIHTKNITQKNVFSINFHLYQMA
jgi:hypothetical protein